MAGPGSTDTSEVRGWSLSALWPDRVLGRRPGLKEVNVVCWGLFVAFLVVPLLIVSLIRISHGPGFVRSLHSDFVYFYGDGQIAASSPARLYDYRLQQQTFTALYPAHEGVYGPSPYPPFVALFFSLFTHVSFEVAYALWFGVSLALYLLGVGLTARLVYPGERLKSALVLCFALACYPFLFSTLINAQLSAVAVCAAGTAIYQERRGKYFVSGLALALLMYKPTLLLLLCPMLILTRRFRTALGFVSGAAILLAVSTIFAGAQIWQAYFRLLLNFGRLTGLNGSSRLELRKYVDLSSFLAAASGTFPSAGKLVFIAVGVISVITLALLLWRSAKSGQPAQWLAWAATLTWTLLLNVYVPIYDSVLAVLAVILTLGALRDLKWDIASEWITLLAVTTFAVSWKTVSFAQQYHVQLLSIMLFLLATTQLWFLHRAIRQGKAAAHSLAA